MYCIMSVNRLVVLSRGWNRCHSSTNVMDLALIEFSPLLIRPSVNLSLTTNECRFQVAGLVSQSVSFHGHKTVVNENKHLKKQ